MKGKTLNILYILMLGLLWLPMVQNELGIFEQAELGGTSEEFDDPDFYFGEFTKGNYQNSKEDYIKNSMAFRASLIRIHNQIAYSFFDYAKANGVIVGKENYLFEEGYIDSYSGKSNVDNEEIEGKFEKLKLLNDTLTALGIDFMITIAPSKATFYSQYIPDRYLIHEEINFNYNRYAELFMASNIKILDVSAWFEQIKDTASFPLFPKTGTHWSKYAELLVADSLSNFISDRTAWNLPKVELSGIRQSIYPWDTDHDIEKGMNLLFDIPDLKMNYADYQLIPKRNEKIPKAITIGDSFYWGIMNYGLADSFFKEHQFWYYNTQRYNMNIENLGDVNNIDIKKEAEKVDLIIIFTTISNLNNLGFGFIDQLYEAYFEPEIYRRKQRIKEISEYIKSNEEWLENVKNQALEKNISLDEAIQQNAIYYVTKEDEGNPL